MPSSTSWCATRPRRRTECTWIPAGPTPPRAPSTTVSTVGSAAQSGDAAAIRAAVSIAVPDGASTFCVVVQLDDLGGLEVGRGELGEAHHQHRADGEVRGDHRVGAAASNRAPMSSSSSAAKPVVPTTACTPWSAHQREVVAGGVDDGEVDRHLGTGVGQRVGAAAPPAGWARRHRAAGGRSRRAVGSTAATSSSSGSSTTARHTVAPIRPAAPNTPTRIIGCRLGGHRSAAAENDERRDRARRRGRRPRACADRGRAPVRSPGRCRRA